MKKYLLLGSLLLAVLAYGVGQSYKGQITVTNTVATGGGGSSVSGTITGFNMVPYNVAIAQVVIEPSPNVARGYGLSDSGYVYAYTELGNTKFLVGGDSAAALPCTLQLRLANTNDTLWKEFLIFDYVIADSASDTAMTATHKITWDVITRE